MEKCGKSDIKRIFVTECSSTSKHVFPHITLVMIVRWLGNSLAGRELGQNVGKNPQFPEIFQCHRGSRPEEHLRQFLKNARAREDLDCRSLLQQRRIGLWMILPTKNDSVVMWHATEKRTKPHGTQKPERIMLDAYCRIPNEANEPLM